MSEQFYSNSVSDRERLVGPLTIRHSAGFEERALAGLLATL